MTSSMTPEMLNLLAVIVGAVQAVALAYIAWQQAAIQRVQLATTGKIETLEKNTNSIKDALVETTKHAAFAEGVKTEKDRQQDIAMRVDIATKGQT